MRYGSGGFIIIPENRLYGIDMIIGITKYIIMMREYLRQNGIDPVTVTIRERNARGEVVTERRADTPRDRARRDRRDRDGAGGRARGRVPELPLRGVRRHGGDLAARAGDDARDPPLRPVRDRRRRAAQAGPGSDRRDRAISSSN